MKIWIDLSSILSGITRMTDRRTDRIAIPRLHYMQRGKNDCAGAQHVRRTCAMNVYTIIHVRRTCTSCMCDVYLYTLHMHDVHVRQCKHSSYMYAVHVRRTCTPYMYDSVNTALKALWVQISRSLTTSVSLQGDGVIDTTTDFQTHACNVDL